MSCSPPVVSLTDEYGHADAEECDRDSGGSEHGHAEASVFGYAISISVIAQAAAPTIMAPNHRVLGVQHQYSNTIGVGPETTGLRIDASSLMGGR